MSRRPVRFVEVGQSPRGGDRLQPLFDGDTTGVVVRRALSPAAADGLAAQIGATSEDPAWDRPNEGMAGGEIRVVGAAATPTFRTPGGPTLQTYLRHAAEHDSRTARILGRDGDPWPAIRPTLTALAGGRAATRPVGASGTPWPPFNVRRLDPGQQIYAHHDAHYRLPIYDDLDGQLARTALLSWFVPLAMPDSGGALIVYGARGDDAELPYLPTRFLDHEALDRDFDLLEVALRPGDLVVFDSGRHVHRVSQVQGPRPRLTIGGFVGAYAGGSRIACWS